MERIEKERGSRATAGGRERVGEGQSQDLAQPPNPLPATQDTEVRNGETSERHEESEGSYELESDDLDRILTNDEQRREREKDREPTRRATRQREKNRLGRRKASTNRDGDPGETVGKDI